jgi:hypothetical protein
MDLPLRKSALRVADGNSKFREGFYVLFLSYRKQKYAQIRFRFSDLITMT